MTTSFCPDGVEPLGEAGGMFCYRKRKGTFTGHSSFGLQLGLIHRIGCFVLRPQLGIGIYEHILLPDGAERGRQASRLLSKNESGTFLIVLPGGFPRALQAIP